VDFRKVWIPEALSMMGVMRKREREESGEEAERLTREESR
jgi:hypothetical protein